MEPFSELPDYDERTGNRYECEVAYPFAGTLNAGTCPAKF